MFDMQEGELGVGEEGDWYVCGGHGAFLLSFSAWFCGFEGYLDSIGDCKESDIVYGSIDNLY